MLGQEEADLVAQVLSGTTLVHGPISKAFEEEFAARAGAKHAVSVSSCTAGLHLSLLVSGIKAGDEVILPAMTHVATAHAVEFCGGKPVFADVEADSGNISPDAVDAAVSENVRAIMPVHYLGLPCNMDRINRTADKQGAIVVEDCALAVDATYDGQKAGTLGLTGCFSFYPVKHITSVEGGMVTTNDGDMATAIAKRKAFGYDRSLGQRLKPGIYDVDALGYNYRMSEVHAAVGLAQLRKLDGFQKARAENFAALRDALADIEEITVFAPQQGKSTSTHYCLNAVLPRNLSIDRSVVVDHLKANGIGTSVHYPSAVPLLSYYREKYGYINGQHPVAEWLAAKSISLPVGPHLTNGDPQRIADAMKEAIAHAK